MVLYILNGRSVFGVLLIFHRAEDRLKQFSSKCLPDLKLLFSQCRFLRFPLNTHLAEPTCQNLLGRIRWVDFGGRLIFINNCERANDVDDYPYSFINKKKVRTDIAGCLQIVLTHRFVWLSSVRVPPNRGAPNCEACLAIPRSPPKKNFQAGRRTVTIVRLQRCRQLLIACSQCVPKCAKLFFTITMLSNEVSENSNQMQLHPTGG